MQTLQNYVPLHCHTYYSALDGSPSPEEYMKKCSDLGIDAISINDHGTNAGHREFQRAADKYGIKPILGMEAYYTEDMYDRRSKAKRQDGTQAYNHLTLLAQNQGGVEDMYWLNRKAHTEGFYSKPRMDMNLLFERSDNLIVLSGCMSGMIAKAIQEDNMDRAYDLARQHKEALGDRFYIEVMGTNAAKLNLQLLELADNLGIKPVMSSDCHYLGPEDLEVEQALLILSTSPKPDFTASLSRSKKMDLLERFNYLYPDRMMTFEKIDVSLKSLGQEQRMFESQGITRTDIYENTNEISNRIGDYEYYSGLDMLPQPKENPTTLLRKKIQEHIDAQPTKFRKKHADRAWIEELPVIEAKNLEPYFLVVLAIIEFCRRRGIRVGPGRGSAAGSVICYILGITDVDPIEHGLIFGRFLDPERDDNADIDIDIEDSRRHEVIDFIKTEYFDVTGLITKANFQGKSSIRDAARVFRIPLDDVTRALKNNDASLSMNESYEYYDWFISTPKGEEFNNKHPEVVELARGLYGKIKSFGRHASAIIASKEAIHKYAPVESMADPDNKGQRLEVLFLDKEDADDVNFIKFDILGLKTLSNLSDAASMVADRKGIDINLNALKMDDPKVYAMLNKGYTSAVFQAEQSAFTSMITLMGGMYSFDDISAATALIRPGARHSIGDDFIARKLGKQEVVYDHPDTEPFTRGTYGLATLFQEHSMRLVTDLAGMSVTDANRIRKVLSKKKDVSLIDEFHDRFIKGASKKVGEAKAEKLWGDIALGAEYSFNKSHAVAYSFITYWTAWFKVYYPHEYMAAVVKNEKSSDSISDYVLECNRLKLKVKVPHVNRSAVLTTAEGDNGIIRLGLSELKYVGHKAAERLVSYQPYGSYEELKEKISIKNNGLTKRTLGALNAVGAAYFKGENPLTGQEGANLYEYLNIPSFTHTALDYDIEKQLSTLAEINDKGAYIARVMVRNVDVRETWARAELIDDTASKSMFCNVKTSMVKDNMYLMLIADGSVMRSVPLDKLGIGVQNAFVLYLDNKIDISNLQEGHYISIALDERITKAKQEKMGSIVAVDHLGQLHSMIMFPKTYAAIGGKIAVGRTFHLPINEKEDGTKIINERKKF